MWNGVFGIVQLSSTKTNINKTCWGWLFECENSWNFTSSRSSCSDSAKRLSFEPRSESISDCSDGACSEFMAIFNLFYSIYRGFWSTLQPSQSNVKISNFSLLLPPLLLLFLLQIKSQFLFYFFKYRQLFYFILAKSMLSGSSALAKILEIVKN